MKKETPGGHLSGHDEQVGHLLAPKNGIDPDAPRCADTAAGPVTNPVGGTQNGGTRQSDQDRHRQSPQARSTRAYDVSSPSRLWYQRPKATGARANIRDRNCREASTMATIQGRGLPAMPSRTAEAEFPLVSPLANG